MPPLRYTPPVTANPPRNPPAPPVRFVHAPGRAPLAYTSRGRGSAIVLVPNVQMSHLVSEWSVRAVRQFSLSLARSHRLIRYDSTGSGLSPSASPRFDLESLAADIPALLDGLALDRAALFGNITGGLPAMTFAAANPGRVSHLVLWNSFARNTDHGANPRLTSLFAMAATDWELFTESISQAALGWRDSEAARGWAATLRAATEPVSFHRYLAERQSWDVTDLLAHIQCPTLVLFDPTNRLASEERSRELAAAIPNATFMRATSESGMPDAPTIALIEQFLRDAKTATFDRPPGGLSLREVDVLRELATGATNAEIAERLSISINTVARHLTHIYVKTGSSNRVEAVRYAERRELVD